MAKTISLDQVESAAHYIVELNQRLFRKNFLAREYAKSELVRTSCMDNLEGLKTLLIRADLHQTDTYKILTDLWTDVLHWS